ncbi:MAG: GGDEF domain-containing protein [Clostridiaceae bacterium]|nr:GGDEF domain-containing protein [Clostridiaceae bacterium]
MVEFVRMIDLNIMTIIILLMLLLAVYQNRLERNSISTKLFMLILGFNILMVILDVLSWAWNGKGGTDALFCNYFWNAMLFCLSPVPTLVWNLYVHYEIFHDRNRLMVFFRRLLPIPVVNAILTVVSLRMGWYFTISPDNLYLRGPLFPLHLVINIGLLFFSGFIVIHNHAMIERRNIHAMLIYMLLPVVGVTIQYVWFGLSLNWVSMMLATFIVYLQMQAHGMNTDFLTKTYNRQHFETLINDRIRHQSQGPGFAVILADLDDFKQINDQFGHEAGDEALQIAVRLMRSSLRRNDLIARFGGDEFYILLNLNNEMALHMAVNRIYEAFELYSQTSGKPYRLGLSMGSAVYDRLKQQNAEQYLRSIDLLMYQEKAYKQKQRLQKSES